MDELRYKGQIFDKKCWENRIDLAQDTTPNSGKRGILSFSDGLEVTFE